MSCFSQKTYYAILICCLFYAPLSYQANAKLTDRKDIQGQGVSQTYAVEQAISNSSHENLNKALIGQYNIGSTRLYLLEDDRYVIIAYATLIKGKWQATQDKYLYLYPDTPKYPFQIYGRYTASLEGKTRLHFAGGDFSDETLIHFGKVSKRSIDEKTQAMPEFKPIFSQPTNCFDWSYSTEQSYVYDGLSFIYHPNQPNLVNDDGMRALVYSFNNPNKYNDFIAYEDLSMLKRDSVQIAINNQGLKLEEDDTVTLPKPLPDEHSEEGAFVRSAAKFTAQPSTVYYNLDGKPLDVDTSASTDYQFDKARQAYIAKQSCSKDCSFKDEVDNANVFYAYQLLEDVKVEPIPFTIDDKSLLHLVCER